jgi:hypothetical protein
MAQMTKEQMAFKKAEYEAQGEMIMGMLDDFAPALRDKLGIKAVLQLFVVLDKRLTNMEKRLQSIDDRSVESIRRLNDIQDNMIKEIIDDEEDVANDEKVTETGKDEKTE